MIATSSGRPRCERRIDRGAEFGLIAFAERQHARQTTSGRPAGNAHALHVDADHVGDIGQAAVVAARIDTLSVCS